MPLTFCSQIVLRTLLARIDEPIRTTPYELLKCSDEFTGTPEFEYELTKFITGKN